MSDEADYLSLDGRVAGFVSRASAFAIDAVLVTVTLGLIGLVIVSITDLFDRFLPRDVRFDAIYLIAIPFLVAIYYVGMWTLAGATVGKWILGLRVVRADGYPPTFLRSLIRFIGYFLSAIVFFLGFLWVLVDEEHRAWHDDLAGTWVVYDFSRRSQGDVYAHRIEAD